MLATMRGISSPKVYKHKYILEYELKSGDEYYYGNSQQDFG